MFTQPIDIPDELWIEIESLLKKYEDEIIRLSSRSIGADSFSIDCVQLQFENDSAYGDIWNIVKSHYAYFISDIHRNNITSDSVKRQKVAEYYIAVLDEENRKQNIEYEKSAFSQTLNEYSEEFVFYIEKYPDFIKEANKTFTQIENNPIY